MTNKIKALLDARYGLRPQRLHATVTAVPLVAGRSAGYVTATVGGVGGVRVNVSPDLRAPLTVGDTLVVEGAGTPAATEYWSAGRIGGARADSDVYQFPNGGTAGSTTMAAGDILLGSTLADWSNWWYQFELGRWQIRKGTLLHGAIGDLNGLYGYATSTYGSAFGQYSAGQVNITTDPTNGFRIRNYTTDVFQADTSGVVWALSTFRAGTGDDMVGLSATDATWRLYAGSATPASAPFRVDKDGALTATGATISGAITATSGTFTGTVNATAGYFGDGATRVAIEAAGINVGNTGSIRGGRTAWDTGTGFWLGYASGAYRFAIGAAGGREMVFDGTNLTLNGALVTQLYQGSEPSLFGWQCTCVFSATDLNTVAWTSGTFTLSEGTAYSINAGNTGNMAARTYIYLDKAVSTTALQTTTTASTAVGSGKVLIATAINSTTEALWQVFSGTGGVQIGGGQIEQRSITASEIATGTLTANEIAANTITAGQIAAGTITTTQIAANTIVAGNIAAGTITGAQIAASTITAGLLSVTAGGRNLLLNSTFQMDTDANGTADAWAEYNNSVGAQPGTMAVVATGGVDNRAFQRLTWSVTNTTTKGIWTDSTISGGVQGGWLPNTSYIISFYAKTSSISAYPYLTLYWNTAPTTTETISGPLLSTSWQLYCYRVTWGASVNANGGLAISIINATAITGNLEFDHVQVEQSDTPSAWKPFPSELEPGSVTADKISVTSLSAIEVDTGALNMSGFLTIDSSGGIYQGTGTAASPTTGLKMWNDGGVGRIAGYNASVLQWYAGTDGKLYAGAGAVTIDADGIGLEAGGATTPNSITWYDGANSVAGVWASTDTTPTLGYLGLNAESSSTQIQLGLIADSTNDYVWAELVKNSVSSTFKGLRVGGIGSTTAPSTALEVVGDIGCDGVYKVDGTQVISNRVVDARADDTVNTSSWDSTTAGVLDALRDAMITHGLIAAA